MNLLGNNVVPGHMIFHCCEKGFLASHKGGDSTSYIIIGHVFFIGDLKQVS